jgi:hypothetical protein
MTVANIDTFEHDISEEIKHKDASLTAIASASGDIGNLPTVSVTSPIPLLLLSVFLILASGITGYLGYVYYENKVNPPARTTPVVIPTTNNTTLLPTVSSQFPNAIGYVVTSVTQSEYGYTIMFSSYSTVFAYMIKNESSFADDIAKAVGNGRDTSTTTPPFTFTDATITNQNMRVGTSGSSTVVYSFINDKALVIASSTANILSLRNAILH